MARADGNQLARHIQRFINASLDARSQYSAITRVAVRGPIPLTSWADAAIISA